MRNSTLMIMAVFAVATVSFSQPFEPDEFTEALWHFDEMPGTYIAFDATGNGYNMALEDGAEFTPAGQYAGAVDMTDPDAKINSDYLIGNGWDELTIDAHVKLTMFNPDENPVVERYQYYASNPAYYLTIMPGGQIYAGVYQTNGGYTSLTTPPVITLNTWYYIQMTWRSGGELKIFVDGILVDSAPSEVGAIRNSTHPLTIGWFHDTGYGDFYMNGYIDEVRISDIDRSEPPPPPPPICFEEHWDDGNWTANPTWYEYENMGNFAINEDMGFEAVPCLEGWAGNIGTDYTALYTPVDCGEAFIADFWVHKRTTDFSVIMIGFSEGAYSSANRGFRVRINYSNIIWDWELIIYDVDGTQLFYAVIDYDDDRWTNIHMEREPTGNWAVIWDYNGPYEITAYVTDSFATFDNPHLWVHPAGYYGNTGGFYLDDIVIYTAEPPVPPLNITMTPYNPPIVIPPGGDAFAFNVEIANNGNEPVTFDTWINIEVPGGFWFTVLGPVNDLTLAAGNSIERDRTVFVPENAPPGEYVCMGMIGTYPWNIVAADAFPFVKEGMGGEWVGPSGWICSGESFPGEAGVTPEVMPEAFSLGEAYPNPFNPTTTISFALPEAAYVTLEIYDVSGRLVESPLQNIRRDVGVHEVTLDAGDLSSGLYFYRIQTGDYSAVKKMILMK